VRFIWHCLQMESIMYLTLWGRVLVEKVIVLQLVMRSGAVHWHHLPKTHLNIMCVCLLTCSKWLEWLIWIILFVHVYNSNEMHLKSTCVFYYYILFSPTCSGSSEPTSGRTKYKGKHHNSCIYKDLVQYVYIFTSKRTVFLGCLYESSPVPLRCGIVTCTIYTYGHTVQWCYTLFWFGSSVISVIIHEHYPEYSILSKPSLVKQWLKICFLILFTWNSWHLHWNPAILHSSASIKDNDLYFTFFRFYKTTLHVILCVHVRVCGILWRSPSA
jgi:hypothetical protein